VPLVPGPATVVATHVNVRGQAKLKSEVVTRVTKGDSVTVIEEIVRNNSGPDEPSAWAKVVLPPGAHVWINTAFIDGSNQTVKPKKLNLRSGPGENFSVIGLLHAGDAVKPVTTKGDWTEIEPPATAYAFMAAQYLSQEAPTPPVTPPPIVATTPPTVAMTPPVTPTPTPTPTEPAPTPATVATTPPVAPPPTEAPVVPPTAESPAVTNVVPPAVPAVTTPPPPEKDALVEEEPLPPRIVQREGIVRGMTSIQAPSKFVLISPENGKDIDYLFTTSKELDLRRYKGLRIIVTGEEGLDERWGNTPVLTIQKIQVVE
jgi:SH3-like domain-containing protein